MKVERVFCGPTASAAVSTDGELFLFGEWNGNTDDSSSCSPMTIPLPPNTTASQISFGIAHCALLVQDKYTGAGKVFTWVGSTALVFGVFCVCFVCVLFLFLFLFFFCVH
jgi:hypothetical protein